MLSYAPEIFGASHRPTVVDIYSLCWLYIELFVEKMIWEGLGMQIMQKVCGSYNIPPQMPHTDHLPLTVTSICKGCCELDSKQYLKINDITDSLKIYNCHWLVVITFLLYNVT